MPILDRDATGAAEAGRRLGRTVAVISEVMLDHDLVTGAVGIRRGAFVRPQPDVVCRPGARHGRGIHDLAERRVDRGVAGERGRQVGDLPVVNADARVGYHPRVSSAHVGGYLPTAGVGRVESLPPAGNGVPHVTPYVGTRGGPGDVWVVV